jgi:hypothetical protein
MRYGDGDGSTFKPLTALDVIAHEMGHGIAQFTANFNSGDGRQECDALNEGFSDIWGACVEHWAAPNKQMWLIGEEIFYSPAYSCLRNLQNPKDPSAMEGQHPNTYHGQFWDYNGEPHNNSTVLSHWFYLLSQGGSGSNDLGNTYNVNGIGINEAQSIIYITEQYLFSSSDYAATRNASIQAARNLYGINSCEEMIVTNAWYAVGVGSKYQYPSAISGPTQVCNQENYNLCYLPSGSTVAWSKSANLNEISGQGTAQYTVGVSTDGPGWVQATVNGIDLPQKNIWVGEAFTPNITAEELNYMTSSQIYPEYKEFHIPVGLDITLYDENRPAYQNVLNNFTWTWSQQNISYGTFDASLSYWGSPKALFIKYDPGVVLVRAQISSDYGITYDCSDPVVIVAEDNNNSSMILSPNPATSMVQVNIIANNMTPSLQATSTNNTTTSASYSVRIVDIYGITVYIATKTEGRFTLPTASLKNGIYAIIVSNGNKVYQKKLVIKH